MDYYTAGFSHISTTTVKIYLRVAGYVLSINSKPFKDLILF